jgi:hypothetical protein
MKDFRQDRREFLKLTVSVPVALSVGIRPGLLLAGEKTPLGPGDSLRKLVCLLGPWKEKEKADDFAARFLRHASGPYLPGSEGVVRSLAARFPTGVLAVKDVALKDLPPEERKLLLDLVSRLYTLMEVRFHVQGEPPPGQCQTDRLRYTRAPR